MTPEAPAPPPAATEPAWPHNLVLAGLCLFAGTVCLSVSLSEAGLGLALLGSAARWLHRPSGPDGPRRWAALAAAPLLLPWTLYLAASLATAACGIDVPRSLSGWHHDLEKAAAFILLSAVLPRRGRGWIAACYLAGALVAAGWGIGQVVLTPASVPVLPRAHGSMNAVTYGELLALALGLSVSLFLFQSWGRKAWLLLACAAALALALGLSHSRGALLGTAAMMAGFFALRARARLSLAAVALALGLGLAAVARHNPVVADKLASIPRLAGGLARALLEPGVRVRTAGLDPSTRYHLTQWKVGAAIIRDYPVTGVGPSNVRRIFSYYHPEAIDSETGWGNVHNLYLQQGAERGLLGLGVLLLLLAAMLRLAWRSYRREANPYTLWAAAGLPGFLVMNLTETSFQHAVVAMSVALMLALAAPSPQSQA